MTLIRPNAAPVNAFRRPAIGPGSRSVRIEALVTPRELADAWSCTPALVLDLARREGVAVVDLGYRTKRLRAADVETLQAALLRKGKVSHD